jgi:proteasome lid subunit RPN8/RPN11
MSKKPIFVKDAREAEEAFLAGEDIETEQSRIETIVEAPLEWTMPLVIAHKIRVYREIMDQIPYLENCEIGFMPVFEDKRSNHVKDVVLFHQAASEIRLDYSDESAHEVYERIETKNKDLEDLLHLGGIFHFHPAGVSGPSKLDLKDFEKNTWRNLHYFNSYGWVDVTDEFNTVVSEDNVRTALETKDAVLLTEQGDTKVYFKVSYSYSLFLIHPRDAENPWVGVGECKEYCFDGGSKSYRLLKPEDGTRLTLVDEDCDVHVIPSEMEYEIRDYVKRIVIPERKRVVVPSSITHMPVIYQHPEIVRTIEDKMPTTVEEFLALLGDFGRFAEDTPDAQAIRRVHDLFAGTYASGGYEEQLEKARATLRGMSPAYDQAMRTKNGEK